MPLPKRPYVASFDQVRITREGDAAIIEYADTKVGTTHFTIGKAKLDRMTDEQILDLWNDGVAAREEHAQEYEHVAVEVPLGSPQLRYSALADQWCPRGDVIRAEILGFSSSEPDAPFISIDGHDLTPHEFAKMMSTFGGWGVRLEFVPADETHERPEIEVREPEDSPEPKEPPIDLGSG